MTLHQKKEKLSFKSQGKKKTGRKWPGKTFEGYCGDIGISRRTGFEWLSKYFPEESAERIVQKCTIPPKGLYHTIIVDPPWPSMYTIGQGEKVHYKANMERKKRSAFQFFKVEFQEKKREGHSVPDHSLTLKKYYKDEHKIDASFDAGTMGPKNLDEVYKLGAMLKGLLEPLNDPNDYRWEDVINPLIAWYDTKNNIQRRSGWESELEGVCIVRDYGLDCLFGFISTVFETKWLLGQGNCKDPLDLSDYKFPPPYKSWRDWWEGHALKFNMYEVKEGENLSSREKVEQIVKLIIEMERKQGRDRLDLEVSDKIPFLSDQERIKKADLAKELADKARAIDFNPSLSDQERTVKRYDLWDSPKAKEYSKLASRFVIGGSLTFKESEEQKRDRAKDFEKILRENLKSWGFDKQDIESGIKLFYSLFDKQAEKRKQEDEKEKRREEERRQEIEKLRARVNRLFAEGNTPKQIGSKVKQPPEKVIEILTQDIEEEIDIDTIEAIHGIERQQDGFISFCRKVNEEHQNLAGIKVSQLREYLPGILPWLLKDAYFSINASYRAAPWTSRVTGLPAPWRKEKHLRYLNACYCDLDCYKAGLDWSEAVQLVLKAQDEDLIPPASIIGRSGQGVYLLWILTSERLGAQQRAFPQEIELYKRINKLLITKLAEYESKLSPDIQAFDAARILRVPGSEHTKAKQPVRFIVQVVAGGQVPVYTLKQLANTLNVSVIPQLPEPSKPYLRPIKNRGSVPARRQGKIATGNYRVSDLLTIAQCQGGFKKGWRWKSISYFCYFAKAGGYTLRDIEEQATELAKKCRPPYPSDPNDTPIADIVKTIWIKPTRRFRNDYLARFFNVTPELAEELNLHSIIPVGVAKKRAEGRPQEKARTERRKAIKAVICKHPGNIPSLRQLQARLEEEGLNAGVSTVRRDLQAVIKAL